MRPPSLRVRIGLCAGTEAGCLVDADSSACTENLGTCDEESPGTCDGDSMVLGCNVIQPELWDCSATGGTCEGEGEELKCVGLAVDAACSDGFLECGDGLICEGATEESFGTCVADGE